MFFTELNDILGAPEPEGHANAKEAFVGYFRDGARRWAEANPRENEKPDLTCLSSMQWIADVIEWMPTGLWNDALRIFDAPAEATPSGGGTPGPTQGYGSQSIYQRGMHAAREVVQKAALERPEMSRKELYQLCAFLRAAVGVAQGSAGLPGFFWMFDMSTSVVPQMRTQIKEHYLDALPELKTFLQPIHFSSFSPRSFEHPAPYTLPSGAKIRLNPDEGFASTELWHPNLNPEGWDEPLRFQSGRLSSEQHVALVGEFARQTWVQRGGGTIAEMVATALAPAESRYPPVNHHPSLWLMANLLEPGAFAAGFRACDQKADWHDLTTQLRDADQNVSSWLRNAGVSNSAPPHFSRFLGAERRFDTRGFEILEDASPPASRPSTPAAEP